jgi:hypothetical protein
MRVRVKKPSESRPPPAPLDPLGREIEKVLEVVKAPRRFFNTRVRRGPRSTLRDRLGWGIGDVGGGVTLPGPPVFRRRVWSRRTRSRFVEGRCVGMIGGAASATGHDVAP